VKVVLVHNRYQQPGGEDRVFESELELLTSHGHEVLPYTAHNDAVGRRSNVSLALGTTWSRTTYRDLRTVLRRERPHIVHVHNTLPLLSPAVYYAATTRRPDLASRFLFITGNMDDPEPWRFLAKIRAHVLEKPFTGRALRHALIKVIA